MPRSRGRRLRYNAFQLLNISYFEDITKISVDTKSRKAFGVYWSDMLGIFHGSVKLVISPLTVMAGIYASPDIIRKEEAMQKILTSLPN